MHRTRKLLLVLALVVGSLGAFVPARACTGDVCDGICDFANNTTLGHKLFPNGCPLR
jgi:hypothetical protein